MTYGLLREPAARRGRKRSLLLALALVLALSLISVPGAGRPPIQAAGATGMPSVTGATQGGGSAMMSANLSPAAVTGRPAEPLALGGPDHMLGFAAYHTRAIVHSASATAADPYPWGQGFYLELRGPASGLEHGDAFSPFFATLRGDSIMTVGGGSSSQLVQSTCAGLSNPAWTMVPFNICTEWSNASGSLRATPDNLQVNPYYNRNNRADPTTNGYNFSFSLPANMQHPMIIKVLDPYDNCLSTFMDQNRLRSQTVFGPDGHQGLRAVSSEFIDQCSTQYFGEVVNNAFQRALYPTALKFTLSQPYVHLIYPLNPILASGVSTYAVDGNGGMVTVNTGPIGNGQMFSVDPTGGARGYQWFSLASVQNTTGSVLHMRLTVRTGGVPVALYGNSLRYGNGGNNFSLGVCKSNDGTLAAAGDPGNNAAWLSAGTIPSEARGALAGQDTGCADPNYAGANGGASDGYGCSDGTVTCYHVNAIKAIAIETMQPSAGPTYIPLAQVDRRYAGSTLSIRLYDAGDIGNGGTNTISILAPADDPGVINGANISQPYGLDLSAPALSGYSQIGDGRNAAGPNAFMFQQGCNDYNATDYGPTGPLPTDTPLKAGTIICPPLNGTLQTTGVVTANPTYSNRFANGTWLTFHVPIASTYDPAANNQWWKVFYNLVGSGAVDTTTWEVSIDPQPVSIGITSSENPSIAGQAVTLSAKVRAAGTSQFTPTGTVTFSDNGSSMGTFALDDKGSASISTSSLTVGDHTIAVSYSGDDFFVSGAGPSTPFVQKVESPGVAPVVTLNPQSQSAPAGSPVTFTAAATGNPTPTVQWQVSVNGGASFANVSGATSTTLTFITSAGQNGNQYRAVFSNTINNVVNTATTTAATLTVSAALPCTISALMLEGTQGSLQGYLTRGANGANAGYYTSYTGPDGSFNLVNMAITSCVNANTTSATATATGMVDHASAGGMYLAGDHITLTFWTNAVGTGPKISIVDDTRVLPAHLLTSMAGGIAGISITAP